MGVRLQRLLARYRRPAWGILAALWMLTASGCAGFQGVQNYLAYNDATNDFVMGWRNSVWARQAWSERKSQFVGEPQFVDFGAGFRAGYEDVAAGGSGCPPTIPPRSYWSWKYQSPEGQAKVAAWFAGYPHGARAAEEDGAGLYQGIQVSHLIEQQYSPEFLNGTCVPVEVLPATDPAPVKPASGTAEPLPAGPSINQPLPLMETSAAGSNGLLPVAASGALHNGAAWPAHTGVVPAGFASPQERRPVSAVAFQHVPLPISHAVPPQTNFNR